MSEKEKNKKVKDEAAAPVYEEAEEKDSEDAVAALERLGK